jgi:hypothetical protein
MAIVVKDPKIIISLIKNVKLNCTYPVLVAFTILKDTGNEHHYLTTSDTQMVSDFLGMFSKFHIKSQTDMTYEYKITGMKETITILAETPKKAKDFWNIAIKDGWRPIDNKKV